MKYATTALALVLCLAGLTACGLTNPSAATGNQVLQAFFEDCFRVESFEKLDGQSLEVFGRKMYQMTFKARIRVQKSYKKLILSAAEQADRGNPRAYREADAKYSNMLSRVLEMSGGKHWADFSVGDLVSIRGTISFVRSENGWNGRVDGDLVSPSLF